MAGNRLQILLSGQVDNFNKALKDAQKQSDETMGSISGKAKETTLALAGLGISATALAKSFVSKAVEMQQFEGTLTAVIGDVKQAKAELAEFVAFAGSTPFDLPGVVEAGVKLRALGQDAQAWLPLAGDLAAVMGRNIPDAASALAKALSGSQDGLTQLQQTYAISKRELIEAGAATKQVGVIAMETAADLAQLEQALKQVISTKFGGTMEAQAKTAAGAFANLSDAIGQLKASMGDELTHGLATFAKTLTSMVEAVNELPGPTKAMMAQMVLAVAAVGSLAAAASGAIVVFGPLIKTVMAFTASKTAATAATVALTAAQRTQAAASAATAAATTGATAANFGFTAATVGSATATKGLTAALMTMKVAIPVIGLAAVGIAGLIHVMGVKNKRAAETLQVQEAMAQRFRDARKEIIAASDALKEYSGNIEAATKATVQKFLEEGKTDRDASLAIIALQEQRDEAIKAGDHARAEILIERIKVLNKTRSALSGSFIAQQEAEAREAEAATQALEAQSEALADYKKKAQNSIFETKKEQLEALDAVLAKIGADHEDYEALALSRVKLAREAADEEKKAAEEVRKENLKGALAELDRLKAISNDNLGDRRRVLKQILAEQELNTDERHRLELELLSLERDINAKRVADAKKAEDEKLRALKDAAQLRSQVLQSEGSGVNQDLSLLKEQLQRGEDVTEQIRTQIGERQRITEELIRARVEADKLGKSSTEQAQLERIAQSEISQARKASARELEDIDRTTAERKKKELLETLRLQDQLSAAQAKSQKNLSQTDLVRMAKERLKSAEQQLRIEAEIASTNATAETKARIAAQLELDIYNLRQNSAGELAKATSELAKQKQIADQMKGSTLGSTMSLEEMAAQQAEMFSGRRRRQKGEEADAGPDETKAGHQLGVDTQAAPPILTPDIIAQLKDALTVHVEVKAPSGQTNSDWKTQSTRR